MRPDFAAGPAPDDLLPDILAISKTMRQLVGLKLAVHDLAPGQDQLLLCIADGEGVPVAELAHRLSVRASTISKMTDILQRKGLVGRQADDDDARRVRVHLTAAGRRMQADVRSVLVQLEAELQTAIGDDRTMLPALAKLNAVLTKRLSRLR